MNVIVANKYKDLINNSNIQIMKVMSGVFKVSEIANSFSGMYYQKIIIDATALEGFPKKEVLKDLASRFDTEKLILFLPPDNSPPKSFLSYLVGINIYNFTDNIKGVIQLINKSNTYDDVMEYSNINVPKEKSEDNNTYGFQSTYLDNGKCVILGIQSVTKGISSTELVYMLKKNLTSVYKKNVIAVEIDKKDFVFFNDKEMLSINSNKIGEFVNLINGLDVVLVDLDHNNKNINICTDVLYLVDPSLYLVNELMYTNKRVFDSLKGKKIVLVNSLLEQKDINIFAREAGISIYFNLPPLNDRIVNPVLNDLLFKLGIVQGNGVDNSKKGLFDFFK